MGMNYSENLKREKSRILNTVRLSITVRTKSMYCVCVGTASDERESWDHTVSVPLCLHSTLFCVRLWEETSVPRVCRVHNICLRRDEEVLVSLCLPLFFLNVRTMCDAWSIPVHKTQDTKHQKTHQNTSQKKYKNKK